MRKSSSVDTHVLAQSLSSQAPASHAAAAAGKVKRPRLIQLDLLRGIAVLMVLGFHSPMNWQMAGAFKPLTAFFTRFCWAGVDLFFVLSGFLVGGLLFEEAVRNNALNIPRFLIRRTLKIWPLYFLFLLAAVPWLAHSGMGFKNSFHAVLPALFFYANYHTMPEQLAHLWSISVEEHFYLLLPLMFFLAIQFSKSTRTALHAVALVGVAAVLGVATTRSLVLWHQPYEASTHVAPTHWRIDGLFFGVLLAYVFHVHPQIWAKTAKFKIPLAMGGALLLTPCMVLSRVRDPFVWTIGYSLLYVGFGAILVAMMHTKIETRRMPALVAAVFGVVAWIGLNSYPIYLWHLPMADILHNLAADRLLARFGHTTAWSLLEVPYFILPVVVGALIGKWVERPTLMIRDRIFPSKAPAVNANLVPAVETTPQTLHDALAK